MPPLPPPWLCGGPPCSDPHGTEIRGAPNCRGETPPLIFFRKSAAGWGRGGWAGGCGVRRDHAYRSSGHSTFLGGIVFRGNMIASSLDFCTSIPHGSNTLSTLVGCSILVHNPHRIYRTSPWKSDKESPWGAVISSYGSKSFLTWALRSCISHASPIPLSPDRALDSSGCVLRPSLAHKHRVSRLRVFSSYSRGSIRAALSTTRWRFVVYLGVRVLT